MMECCGTCMYYKMGLKDWICSCRESEYYIEHPEPNHYCEEWEGINEKSKNKAIDAWNRRIGEGDG